MRANSNNEPCSISTILSSKTQFSLHYTYESFSKTTLISQNFLVDITFFFHEDFFIANFKTVPKLFHRNSHQLLILNLKFFFLILVYWIQKTSFSVSIISLNKKLVRQLDFELILDQMIWVRKNEKYELNNLKGSRRFQHVQAVVSFISSKLWRSVLVLLVAPTQFVAVFLSFLSSPWELFINFKKGTPN